jgi:zinc transport system substrate-binding protein/iron/zinc/copper transport system substrate-binding protein
MVLARDAGLLVYAGYEKFAQRILEASGDEGAKALKIDTDNRPETLIASSRKVAERLGTVAAQEAWAKSFSAYAEASRARVRKALGARRVAVQAQLKSWMEWMGFAVVGTFGPGEPSPAQMLELIKAKPELVIDNYHGPSGQALAESLKVPYALLINFPGKDGTESLEEVYAYDEKALLGAAGR